MRFMRIAVVAAAFAAAVAANAAEYTLDWRTPRSAAGVVPVDGNNSEGVIKASVLPGKPAALPKFAVGDTLELALFDDAVFKVELAKKSSKDAFVAKVEGLPGYAAVVSQTRGGVQLMVDDTAASRTYVVGSTPSGVKVTAFDKKAFSRRCGVPDRSVLEKAKAAKAAKRQAAPAPVADESGSGGGGDDDSGSASGEPAVFVDILVVLDAPAQQYCRTKLNMEPAEFAEASIAKMNMALANTGLDEHFNFRLADAMLISTSVANNCRDGLYVVTDPGSYGRSDLTEIYDRRDEVGADIISVLIDIGGESGTVGISWGLEDEEAPYTEFIDWAINVCNVRNVAVDHTMTHECGHNMGAGHADTPMAQKEDNAGPQLFPYSSGAFFMVNGVYYATIMSYEHYTPGNENASVRVYAESTAYFSSPDYTYEDTGVTVGDATHDNTRTMRETCQYVAAFRSEVRRPTLADALDDETSIWSTTSVGKFQGTYETADTHDGEDAAISSGTTERAYLYAMMALPGEASVWVRPSVADGTLEIGVSGQTPQAVYDLSGFEAGVWTNLTFTIDGENMDTVLFKYSAVDDGNGGYSTLALDEFTWSGKTLHRVVFSGGEHGSVDSSAAVQYVIDGDSAQAPDITPDFGWEFVGWDVDFSEVTGDIVVTAVWQRKWFQVSFVVDGETILSFLRPYERMVSQLPDTPEKPGFEFLGWFANFSGGWVYEVETTTAVTQDIVATPRWQAIKYSIVFDANGGTGTVAKSLEYGTATGSATVTRDGYVFDGWYTEAEGGEKVLGYRLVTGDATYYAHWHKDGATADDGDDEGGGSSGGGVTPGTQPVTPETPDTPPAQEDVSPIDVTKINTYSGAIFDDGEIAGTITIKVSKPAKSSGKASIQAAVVGLDGGKTTYKVKETILSDGPTTIEFADGCTAVIAGESVTGSWNGFTIEAYKVGTAADFASLKGKKYVVVLEAVEAEGDDAELVEGNFTYVSLAFSAKGKVKVKGTNAAGANFSSTAQAAILSDGSIVVPVVAGKASAKAGSFAMYVSIAGGNVIVESTSGWQAKNATAIFDVVDAGVPVEVVGDLKDVLAAELDASGGEVEILSFRISTTASTGLLKGSLRVKAYGDTNAFKLTGAFTGNGVSVTLGNRKFGRMSLFLE